MVLINHIQNTLFKEEKKCSKRTKNLIQNIFFHFIVMFGTDKLINSQLTGKLVPKNSHTLNVLDRKGSLNYKAKGNLFT